MVTFHLGRGREAPWSPKIPDLDKEASWLLRFQCKEALWLPFIKIEVEKPLGQYNSKLRQKSLLINPGFEVEKPLGYHPLKSR